MTESEKIIYEYMEGAHYPQIKSIVLWEKGEIKAECYFNGFNKDSRHNIKSVIKSILSIGTGIAQDKGLLNIDDRICNYLPEFAEQRDVKHRLIKIRHLLTMSSGIFWNGGVHYHCPMMEAMSRSGNWIDYIADCQLKNHPGTEHNYSEFDVILLSAVLTKATGDAFDFINENLFLPLGIQNDRWIKSPDGVYYSPALDKNLEKVSAMRATDMLKLGILFLQKGKWEGKQILSSEYVQQAIAPSPQNENYGFLWWRGPGWYGCRGFGGQTVTVFPEKERVVVTQAHSTSRPLEYNDIIFELLN